MTPQETSVEALETMPDRSRQAITTAKVPDPCAQWGVKCVSTSFRLRIAPNYMTMETFFAIKALY
jgi:hypothetical protein